MTLHKKAERGIAENDSLRQTVIYLPKFLPWSNANTVYGVIKVQQIPAIWATEKRRRGGSLTRYDQGADGRRC